ncbi:SpoIIE family protein phosphatase [candidate division KSB1 bacterium]|nr:SpoIIE family protein phosphatase [candidate division KSB1 bacterium]
MNIVHIVSIFYLTCSVLLFFLGLIIIKENPRQQINRITSIMLFLAASGGIMGACGLYISHEEIDSNIIERFFIFWEFFFPQLVLFALVFPIERSALINHPKKIPFLIYLPHIFQFVLLLLFRNAQEVRAVSGMFETDFFQGIVKPLAIIFQLLIGLLSIFHEYHPVFFAIINLSYVIVAIYLMYRGYAVLRSERLKKQAALVLWGIRSGVGLYAIAFLLPEIVPFHISEYIPYSLTILALLIGVGSIAWAIIKYQFLDIQSFLRKSIIFSMVSAILIGIYLLLYGQSKALFKQTFNLEIPILEVLFLVLAAIFFQPLLSAIENFVERNFLRESTDYRQVLQTLSHDILTVLEIPKLKEIVVRTLTDTMALENAHLILENKHGDFSTEVNGEIEREPIIFHKNSEFIQLMRAIKDPIRFDEVCIRISSEDDIAKLKVIHPFLMFPLKHRTDLEGILCLGNKLTNTRFSAEDVASLGLLSDQIAIAIENSKLYQEKLEKQRMQRDISLAREIQRMLLPHKFPEGAFFEISAINIPSKEVGGDYYDFVQIDDSGIGVVIGDIAGKGIPASLLMSNLQAAFRASVNHSPEPAVVMAQVNRQIAQTTSPEKYATLFFGNFERRDFTFTYTNAGHNFPILCPQNRECQFLRESGLVIGIVEGTQYEQHTLQLQPGDILIFYTDGITEALSQDEKEFGEERLVKTIQQSNWITIEQLRNKIYESVIYFSQGTSQYDDLTLVILQVK